MRGKGSVCLGSLLSLLLLTGCWDSTEVNEIAIELAWGIDNAPNQKVKISAQAIIPSKISGGQGAGSDGGGGSKGKPFFVAASDGLNTLNAVQRMQTKLSRQIFRGHRRVIVIGESMARRGIKDVFDTYTRDPNLKLRTDIFIVKDNTAEQFLKVSYPLENIPGLGVLGEYGEIGTPREMILLNFLLAAASEGACPALPAVGIGLDSEQQDEDNQQDQQDQPQSQPEGFRIVGTGILNKELKLVGFLNVDQGKAMRWVSGQLMKTTVSESLPQEEGNVSMDVTKLGRKIQPVYQGGRLKFKITLTGQGAIRENNTQLDLTQPNNVSLVQKALNRNVEETVLETITKVQKEYGTDVFGFSEAIRRRNVPLWKSVRDDWEEEFRSADISVNAKLTVRRIGVTGPSLQLNPTEVKK